MTTTTEPRPVDECPACGRGGAVALSTTNRFCPHCRHEWDPTASPAALADLPTETPPPPTPSIAMPEQCPACGLVMALGADDVYHCPREAEEDHVRFFGGAKWRPQVVPDPDPDAGADLETQVARARERFMGAEVIVHDLEVAGTITAIDDEGTATVTFGSGFFVEVTPDEFSVIEVEAPTPAVGDATQIALASTSVAIVAQIVRAGQATIIAGAETDRVGVPPNGWLPADVDVIPMLEWGAAYAVATIVSSFGITDDQLEALAASLDNAASAAQEVTTQ